MALRLQPDPGARLTGAVAALLRDEGLLDASEPAHDPPWRRAALREGVAREPTAPHASRVGPYVAALSPRSTRGATRA